MSDAVKLHVATTTADTSYHACLPTPRDVAKSQLVKALCGLPGRVTPRVWGEERQTRMDSCRRCVGFAKKYFDDIAKERANRGPLTAGYIRASTDKQVESPDVQKDIIREHCARHKLGDPVWYVDTAVSGDKPIAMREAGKRLVLDLKRGDHLVVARLDRLSRNFLDYISVLDTWSRQGVTLHPCDFPLVIIPGDHISEMVMGMLSVVARYERRLICQRTREALRWRQEQGRRHTQDPPFGFRWERQGRHLFKVIDEHEAAICIRAVELTLAGMTQAQIAAYLNDVWGVRNQRAFTRPDGGVRRYKNPDRDPKARGRWKQQHITRLVDSGLEIMRIKGIPLPDGVQTRKDLMLQ